MMKKGFYRLILACSCLLAVSTPLIAAPTINYKITGIEDPLLKNATTQLDQAKKSLDLSLGTEVIHAYYRDGIKQIQKAIEPYGYFKPYITYSLTQSNNRYSATYRVKPGPAVRIKTLNIQIVGPGKNNYRLQRALKHSPLKPGDVFDSQKYEKIKHHLLDLAHREGYIRASFTTSFAHVYLNPYECEIKLICNTGPRFFFGPITFSKTPLADSFLRRYLNIHQGKPFAYEKTLLLQETLTGTNYFDQVTIIPQDKKTHRHHIPVKIHLKMRSRQQYKFGLGYGTNSGARGTIGYTLNWVNRYGHQFKAWLKLSHVNNSLSAQYLIPGKNPAKENYTINAAIYQLTPRRGDSIVKNIGVGKTRNFQKWQRTLGLTYEWELYKLNDNVPSKHSRMLYPNITLSHTDANNIFNTKNGYTVSMNLLGSADEVLSTVSMLRAHLTYKQIFSLTQNNRFVFHGEYGYVLVHDMKRHLPLSKYFYTGGINSVRGYRYQGLGPGRFLVLGSAEYQYRVYGDWYAAAFYDIGSAVNHFNDQLKRGVGIGVVWQTKVGALKLYLARALNRKDRPVSFMFNFGPDL